MKMALGAVLVALISVSGHAATYPNGAFAYSAPTLPSNPTGTPGTKYYPATFDDVGILNAINAAHANGGGQIILSSGTYTINTRVALQSNISILGAGKGSTIIKRGSKLCLQQLDLDRADRSDGCGVARLLHSEPHLRRGLHLLAIDEHDALRVFDAHQLQCG
ncbi:MAG: glycosyl hydrolase family 28-related protein [Chthoniobacteraceae bacterium]